MRRRGTPALPAILVLGLAAAAKADGTVPFEIGTLHASPDTVTYTWPADASSTRCSVVRGRTDALPAGPGAADETCFANLPSAALVDSERPPSGSACWYLVRGENTCADCSYGSRGDGAARITTTCPIDPNPPAVSLTSPAPNASLAGTIPVSVTARDDRGVVAVQLRVDGTAAGVEGTTTPCVIDWPTPGVANGLHTLTARARDAAGNETVSLDVADALEFRANRSVGRFRYYSVPFGPLPATFSSSPSGGVTRWSFYGTLVP